MRKWQECIWPPCHVSWLAAEDPDRFHCSEAHRKQWKAEMEAARMRLKRRRIR